MPFIFAIIKANVGFSVIAVLVLTADKGNMVTALLLYQQCLLYPSRSYNWNRNMEKLAEYLNIESIADFGLIYE